MEQERFEIGMEKPGDPLTALLEETRKSNQLLTRQLRWTRGIAVLLAALSLVLVLAGWKAADTLRQIDFNKLSQAVEQLDPEGLNRAMTEMAEHVKGLDVDGINSALSGMGSAANGINQAMQSISGFTDKMNQIFG